MTSGPATSLSASTEGLSGTVDPNGADATYYFEYGSTAALGETTATVGRRGGLSPTSVTATISDLTAGATYDYALVATSALGRSVGATLTFQAATSSCVAEQAVHRRRRQPRARPGERTPSAPRRTRSRHAAVADGLRATMLRSRRGQRGVTAQEALSLDEASATNANTTVTKLPAAGARISRGEALYYLNAQPVPLFYGGVTLYRALCYSRPVLVGPGRRGRLNANLTALGFRARERERSTSRAKPNRPSKRGRCRSANPPPVSSPSATSSSNRSAIEVASLSAALGAVRSSRAAWHS